MEMNPWIESVNIKKQFPDTLIINIKKEIPYALISISDDIFYINSDGGIFKIVKVGEYVDLPIITGLSPNSHYFKEKIKKIVKVLQLIKDMNMPELSEIHITKYGSIYLFFCNKGIQVILSHDIEHMHKSELLKKLAKLKKY